METQTSDINARLARLQRENRRMKKVGIAAACLQHATKRISSPSSSLLWLRAGGWTTLNALRRF